MITGFLVNPDLTRRKIEFELEHANQFLGGATEDRVAVAFQEDGSHYAALFNAEAKAEGAEPNPVAPSCRPRCARFLVRLSSWNLKVATSPMRSLRA